MEEPTDFANIRQSATRARINPASGEPDFLLEVFRVFLAAMMDNLKELLQGV